jgi:hypothetical protein
MPRAPIWRREMPKPLVVDASLIFRLILPGSQQAEVRSVVAGWVADGYEMQARSSWVYELTLAPGRTVHLGQVTAEEGERSLGARLVAPSDELVHTEG